MNIGCFLSLLLTAAPRLAVLFIWLFTPRVDLAFEGPVTPLLGFIFLPFTSFAYVLLWSPADGISGLALAAVIFGLLIDIAVYAGSVYANRGWLPGGADSS